MARKAQQQEDAAVGHMTPARRKQRDKGWCLAHFLLFIKPETPARGMVPPTFTVGLSILLT